MRSIFFLLLLNSCLNFIADFVALCDCRFDDAQGQVIERFLGMKSVADTTSSSLKEALDHYYKNNLWQRLPFFVGAALY